MGERLPRVTADQTLRALRRAGWEVARTRGSHFQLAHAHRPGRVTVAVDAGAILKPKTLLAVLDQAGLSVEEFRELL
jgi:predicted RNA binding protein YcfA (HicA-like mRNA interferase family)